VIVDVVCARITSMSASAKVRDGMQEGTLEPSTSGASQMAPGKAASRTAFFWENGSPRDA
jgi:hypothetical protein